MSFIHPSAEKVFREIKAIFDAPQLRAQSTSAATSQDEADSNLSTEQAKRAQALSVLKSQSNVTADQPNWIPGYNSFPNILEKPDSLDAIVKVVTGADKAKKKVRVIGSGHSGPSEIILGVDDPKDVVLMSLTKYRGIIGIDHDHIATVKAGTNLGVDPNNPDSTPENSLVASIDKEGLALPDTGGIIHQALGGFLQTGSAGGSWKHNVHDAIVGYKVVTGKGEVKTFKKTDPNTDNFYACGISMGLFGIVVEVLIQLQPKYKVKGTQQGYDSLAQGGTPKYPPPVDMFATSSTSTLPNLNDFLAKPGNEFCRMLWWPQRKLERLQIWQATTVTQGATKPYDEITVPMQILAKGVLTFAWQALQDNPSTQYDDLIAFLLGIFIPAGPEKENVKEFCDEWYKILPMDNSVVDTILSTCFTEIYVEKAKAADALVAIKNLHKNDPSSIGNYFIELYAGKQSGFWLSPAYSADKVRIDVTFFLWGTEKGNVFPPYKFSDPKIFFDKYWKALDNAKIPYATHWGKYRPENHCDDQYLSDTYPKYKEWLVKRKEMDPNGVFLNAYWKKHLNIQ